METKRNDRGEKIVKVRNVDTGVVAWKRESAYKRLMKQWELTTEPTTDEVQQKAVTKKSTAKKPLPKSAD